MVDRTQTPLIFKLSSLPFVISIPVHDDTSKFQLNGLPLVHFSEALVASGQEYVMVNQEGVVVSGSLSQTCCFHLL